MTEMHFGTLPWYSAHTYLPNASLWQKPHASSVTLLTFGKGVFGRHGYRLHDCSKPNQNYSGFLLIFRMPAVGSVT